MKRIVWGVVMAAVMAISGLAVAAEDGAKATGGKTGTFGAHVLSGTAAQRSAANDLDVWAKTQPRSDVFCKGTIVHKRPLWQRVLSFGLLGETAEVEEEGVVNLPGGTDSFRVLAERNPDLNMLLGSAVKRIDPTVIKFGCTCISAAGEPLELVYGNNNGKASLEIHGTK
ncbi:hypothetical protein [Trichlorobacter lovleyi]|uniref:hypothetical protein n=1 Tax=Trichlorobacter lovleyi TaxID=313985 RepID=UPI002480600A|nr:hypothetical protein [Trichlorobacter lovleyi]